MKLFKTTSLRRLLQKEPSELSLASVFKKEEDEDTWYDSASTLDFQCSSSSIMDSPEEEDDASVATTTTTRTTATTKTPSSCLKQSESTSTKPRRHRRHGRKQQRRQVRLDTINVMIHEDEHDLTEEEIQAQWLTRAELDDMYQQFRSQGESLRVQTVETIHELYEGCHHREDMAKVNDLVARMATALRDDDDDDILGMARHVSVVHEGLKDRRQKLQELVVRSPHQSRKGMALGMRSSRGERLRLKCQAITQQAQWFAQCLAQAQSCS